MWKSYLLLLSRLQTNFFDLYLGPFFFKKKKKRLSRGHQFLLLYFGVKYIWVLEILGHATLRAPSNFEIYKTERR